MNIRAALLRTLEARQGMTARQDGQPRDANPYKWAGNNQFGDRKRACWEAGWEVAGADEPIPGDSHGDYTGTRARARRRLE